MGKLWILALFATLPAAAELSANHLIGNDDIHFEDKYIPKIVRDGSSYKTNVSGSSAEVLRNKQYKLKMERNAETDEVIIDEIDRKDDENQNYEMRVARIGLKDDKLRSYTSCSGRRLTTFVVVEGHKTEACVTVTPQLCEEISKAGGPGGMQGLKEAMTKCQDLSTAVGIAYDDLFDPGFKKTELANIKHLQEVARGFIEDDALRTSFWGMNEKGSKIFKKTTLQNKNFDSVMDYMMHITRIVDQCNQVDEFFAKAAKAGGEKSTVKTTQ